MRLSSGRGLLLAGILATAYAEAQVRPEQAELSIEQAVAEALAHNPSLTAEKVNVSIADADVLTAGLRPNPVISTGADHLDFVGTGFSEFNGGGPAELNFRTDFTIERGRKRQRRVETAEKARLVARLGISDAARTVVLETQSAFVDALLARDTVALAIQNRQSLHRIVEINEARLRAGDISNVELTRSRLAALQFENSVREGELRLKAALIRIATLTGRDRPDAIAGVTGQFRRDVQVPSLEELKALAIRMRPDLLAARAEVSRAEAEYQLQLAQAKSDYAVGTEVRRQQGVNGKSNSVGLFLEMPLPVFNRNQGEIARASAQRRQLELRRRAQEQAVAAEVETAYTELVTARDLLNAIEATMIVQAKNVRDVTEYSYKRGDATLLELLDAQRAFNETMQSYNEARAAYARALYQIDSVSGKTVNQ